MQKPKLRFGIIGCGLISYAHGIAAQKLKNRCEIICAFNPNAQKAIDFVQKFGGIIAYNNIDKMFRENQLDGVIIASPPMAHFENIKNSIENGVKYILCEKPLLPKFVEAIEIDNLAKKAGVKIIEAFVYRHNSGMNEFFEKLNEIGKIDNIYSNFNLQIAEDNKNWRNDAKKYGGVLYDFLIYPIDFCNFIMKQLPCKIYAKCIENENGLQTKILVNLFYSNNVFATICASNNAGFSQNVLVQGLNGQISTPVAFSNLKNSNIQILKNHDFINYEIQNEIIQNPENDGRLLDIFDFCAQLNSFCDIIDSKNSDFGIDEISMMNSKTIDLILQSLKQSKEIEIN